MFKSVIAAALLSLGLFMTPVAAQDQLRPTVAETAPINGLNMYYEIYGEGPPLVLLHGAYMSIPLNWGALIPTFAKTHKVIAVELQGHGRTSDADRPITYEGMADDVAALLDHLKIDKAAVFGFSLGAGVAIRVAMQHPDKVDRLIVASSSINYDAFPQDFYQMIETFTPEMFVGSPYEAEYKRLSPTPDAFPTLFAKLRTLDLDRFAWSEEDFAKIAAPTLLIFGDADIVNLNHAVKMFTLLGGKQNGDMNGLPKVQLAVLPGTPHTGVVAGNNVEYLKTMVPAFLAQQLPAPPPTMQ
jgi:pimeloyl-ACP methyl ester carboxylesterase